MKAIFLGCLSNTKYQETSKNAVKIIKMLDESYELLEDAPCCGAVSFHTASDDELKKHISENYQWFKDKDITDIVTICAGCYKYFTKYYSKFVPGFDIKVQHLLQLIAKSENLDKLNMKYEGKKLVVTYHDPCHLQTGKPKVQEEPRDILKSIKGTLVFKDMKQSPVLNLCCGSGGGVYSSFKENSDVNSPIVFEDAKKTRAKILLTPCPFCYTALKRAKEENKKIRMDVMKYEDFLIKIIEGIDPLA